MPLTDIQCKALKCPADKPRERASDSGGLYLEAKPNGSKYWWWKYRLAGREKRLSLGTYPDVPLSQARRGRDSARELLDAGKDPVQAKLDAKVAIALKHENNFKAVALAWWEHWRGPKSPRHADYVKRRLEADVFPYIGAVPVQDLTAAQFLAMAKRIETRGAIDIAKRALQTCGQIMRYAVAHNLAERNPVNDVKPGDVLKPRQAENYARLDAKELPTLLRRIETYQGTPVTRLAMKLMALTFVRTGELIGARWDEFDLEAAEWRVPPERMKMRRPHIVPLSRQSIEVVRMLQELRRLSPLLFPGERDHEKPMSNNTILKALERMGYKGEMTGHGFRGLASTVLHEHQFEHAHIEIQLAHVENARGGKVAGAYNHADYLPKRREMMQWWADHLDELRAGAKVVPLKAA